MSARYSAAIIGCGDIGHAHADGYRLNEEVELVAVVDPLEVATDQFRREYGVPRAYRSVEDLFAELTPDLVSVCTWHRLHAAHTIAAAEAGAKAVICEKPMTISLDDADAMIAACEKAKTRLVVGHQRRFTPGWEAAREAVAAGEIGTPELGHGSTTAGLLNVGTHLVDGLRFVLSDPAARWVLGAVERSTNRFEREVPIEDRCSSLVGLETGAQLLVESDLLEWRGRRGILLRIEGSDGIVEATEGHARVLGTSHRGWRDLVSVEAVDSIGGRANARQVAELLRWLEGGPVHRSAAPVGRASTEIMMATYESARCHRVIELPLGEGRYPLQLMIEEGKLETDGSEPYDIRQFLRREEIDEARYAELRAENIGRHHEIMRRLAAERGG
jgi:predicted dehydrogenase